MNLLVDTHVVLWWLAGSGDLAERAIDEIAEPTNLVAVSAASIWEISIKAAQGKLSTDASLPDAVVEAGFEPLPITFAHADLAASLPAHHRDPFDRMLVAQAMTEDLVVVTRDPIFSAYGVPTLAA